MRFSDNGYYIERYVKCDNCGVLIYGAGIPVEHPQHGAMIFCSPWCKEWKSQLLSGVEVPRVPFNFGSEADTRDA
jgi:N-methylhydantoinase B